MAYNPQNPNGQATSANSAPVVVASDQSAIPATLQTQTDTVMIGGVNVKEINAVTPLMGNGVTGTGSQRVTIASDNTVLPGVGAGATGSAPPANASYLGLNDGTNLRGATANSTTYTAKYAQDANLLGTLGTAFSTAGKVDVKGADGDVFVRQATSSNLNADVNLKSVAGGTAINSGVTGAIATGGDTASGASDAGNPLKIGGLARTSPPTAVANAQRVGAQLDIYGKQVVRSGGLREDLGNQATTITSSTSETTIVTADATYKLDLYALFVSNTSATGTKVTLKDSTAGTTRWVGYIPANDVRGFSLDPSGAHKQNAANNNWTLTCGTSVASIEVTALTIRSL